MAKKRFDDFELDDIERNDKRNRPVRGSRIDWNADIGATRPSGTWRQSVQGNLYKSTEEVNRG